VEDAAANGSANAANGENQVAGINSDATNAVADEAPAEQAEHKEKKTRFSDRARLPKEKKSDKPKIDPFAPPPETTLETATRGQQDKPLGLNGDNSKAKKKNPKDEGPKRRFGNEGKKKDSKPAPDPFKAPASAPGSNSTQQ